MDTLINAKVVILGKTNSGKSCLFERYLHDRYMESTEPTIGAAFGSRTVNVGNIRVTLGIWDTAGSERYDAMSRVYYRGAKAAIICHDLTEENSFHRAKYWVNELQTYEESCKLYLCGTKQDLFNANNAEGKSLAAAVQQYAEEIDARVFETSSKTGYGVERLLRIVAEDCAKEIPDTTDKNTCDVKADCSEHEPSKKTRCCA
ncbi:ras-related protein Rab-24-like [Actinia tenebrosa]|uniref:Ras-related protein Rab-24-like n=1 Tax=Actinia tenebrosa TaxID=6105 RepID=A0A6P8INF6_ACTTE|nr:ras-related protein Rab-24-like [Actinia tenebrosa]